MTLAQIWEVHNDFRFEALSK